MPRQYMQTSYTFIHLESNHDIHINNKYTYIYTFMYVLLKHIYLYIYIYTHPIHIVGVLVISLELGHFFTVIPMDCLPLVARRSNPGGRKSVLSKVVELPS